MVMLCRPPEANDDRGVMACHVVENCVQLLGILNILLRDKVI